MEGRVTVEMCLRVSVISHIRREYGKGKWNSVLAFLFLDNYISN